jgi:hypothetical protein
MASTDGQNARALARIMTLMQQDERPDGQPDYFVVLSWSVQRVSTIRDFFFARYAIADAEHYSL